MTRTPEIPSRVTRFKRSMMRWATLNFGKTKKVMVPREMTMMRTETIATQVSSIDASWILQIAQIAVTGALKSMRKVNKVVICTFSMSLEVRVIKEAVENWLMSPRPNSLTRS